MNPLSSVPPVEAIPFEPWFQDPARIARLLLFLELTEEAPKTLRELAAFIEDPTPWTEAYELMCVFEHPRPETAA